LLILSRSVNKHGCHRQFLFLVGRFLKIFFSETAYPNEPKFWWEAPMEGSALSFLKAEWKVSDTGSAHWASSFFDLTEWCCQYQQIDSHWSVWCQIHYDVADENNNVRFWRSRHILSLVSLLVLSDSFCDISNNDCLVLHNFCYSIFTY
jgi:hypothetical protein